MSHFPEALIFKQSARAQSVNKRRYSGECLENKKAGNAAINTELEEQNCKLGAYTGNPFQLGGCQRWWW